MGLIRRASAFARNAHKDQVRKDAALPYFDHLEEVADICRRYTNDPETIATAYLHDTIEDQNVRFEDLVVLFGTNVANAVLQLTNVPAQAGLNRESRHRRDLDRLATSDARVHIVKCADMISNARSMEGVDPRFAIDTYLPELRSILAVLTHAPDSLRKEAGESIDSATAQAFLLSKPGAGSQPQHY